MYASVSACIVALDFFARRPIRRRIRRQSPVHRVNAERKKVVECSLKRPQSERTFREQIPVKGLDMPNIEDNAVSLWNRPVVNGFFTNHPKYFIGAGAGV
jgi:hypothetical protein